MVKRLQFHVWEDAEPVRIRRKRAHEDFLDLEGARHYVLDLVQITGRAV